MCRECSHQICKGEERRGAAAVATSGGLPPGQLECTSAPDAHLGLLQEVTLSPSLLPATWNERGH